MMLFVYPKMLYGKQKALLIESDERDGQTWFGIRNAIDNYCLSYGLRVENVDWRVKTKDDYVSIKAGDASDFEEQLKKLDIDWE